MTNQTKWSVDQTHSEISFKVRHLMIAHVKGEFKTFDASIYTTGKDFATATIDLWIDTDAITTGDTKRDEHLRSAAFFDVRNHKQISFSSSTIEKMDDEGNHELWGDLTMKGITKKIKLNVQFGGIVNDPWGNERAGFAVTGKINRIDWDLSWNATMETGGFMLSEEVSISCDVELINASQREIKMEMEMEPASGEKSIY